MKLEKDDITKLKDFLHGKRETQELSLLKNLIEYETRKNIPDSELKKINNITQKKSNLNKKLKDLGYIIKGDLYIIEKLKEKNLETLISEMNDYLLKYNKLFDIKSIIIFNSYEDVPIKKLNKSLQRIKKSNSKFDIEITTLVNNSTEKDLREIKDNVDLKYFRLFKLTNYIAKNLNIFFAIIYTNNKEKLFLYDNKNYIANVSIKNSYIVSVLNNYYKISGTKRIDIDKIKSHLNKEEIDILIDNILDDVKELKRKSEKKEETVYKLLENIFVHT